MHGLSRRKRRSYGGATTYKSPGLSPTSISVLGAYPESDSSSILESMHTLHDGHRLRRGRVSIQHQQYLVTAVTRNRTPWFEETEAARRLCRNFIAMEKMGAGETLCFVVMPDHFHWLLALSGKYSLSQTVGMLKSQTARAMGQSIWQRGFHDHALREEEDCTQIARYIVANPLRAGITTSVRLYPYWNAIWL